MEARIDTHKTLDPESEQWLIDHFEDVDMYSEEALEEMFHHINIIETCELVKPGATRLERHIVNWINEQAADGYTEGRTPETIESVINDLRKGGCESGFVGHLIYYKDSTPFFDNYETEITEVINAHIGETYDDSVILGNSGFNLTQLKQRLSWTAFEVVADQIASEAGIH